MSNLLPMTPVTAIRIATRSGLKLVEAEIHGCFAIHTTQGAPSCTTLTHIGSGCALAADLPDKDTAIDLVSYLNSLPVDWNYASMDSIDSWPESIRARIRRRIDKARRSAHDSSPSRGATAG